LKKDVIFPGIWQLGWQILRWLVKELAALTPVVLKEQKLRLESRLQEMLVDSFDESRLLVECAVLVEKMDIHEELVRLRSHLKAFGGACS